jgi:dihydrolipoamide dehydrogenase
MKELPKSMAIIGGGVIGCEFATLFNALGADVTVIELLDGLIATQSREASRKLETVFKKRGISVLTGAKVSSIMKDGAVRVSLEDGRVVSVEKVLVAVGRTPNTEGIGAEGAGIKTEGGRVMIDGHCRTNVKGVYAAGDCTGGLLLAHKASYEGKLACDNIMGRARTADYSCIPTTVYTDPEIASVGITEEEAKAKYPGVKVAKFPYLASGKAYLMGKTEGFIKIAGGSDGEILGIEIFGEGACDLIGEAVLAKTLGAKVKDLAETVHAHPTLSEIFQEAAHIFDGKGIHTV